MKQVKTDPLLLFFLFIVITAIAILVPTNISFEEYSNSATIIVKNSSTITIYGQESTMIWENGVATIIAGTIIYTQPMPDLQKSIFALRYGLYGALPGKKEKTYTVIASPGNYIDGEFPATAVFTAFQTDRTIYFIRDSSTLTIIRR